MIKKLKYAAAELLKQNPRTWHWVWDTLPFVTPLLPHDKSYYGFRHLANGKPGLFLDIGANNGISAAGFRRLCPNYRILSIEANRHHQPALERLKRKMRDFDYRIVGAGSTTHELQLYTPMFKGVAIHTHTSSSLSYLETSLRRDFSDSVVKRIVYQKQVVNIVPIDTLGVTPDIVKIDVEGADYEVLLGMSNLLERCRPYVMVEFTPNKMGAFRDFFVERDYRLVVFDEKMDRFQPFDEQRESGIWQECGLQVNVFAIPRERAVPCS